MKTPLKARETQAYWIMSKPVETVRPTEMIRDVAKLFTEKNIGAALVIDHQNKPIGVITKTDLARYEKTDDEEDIAQHWMTPVIFSVKPETPMKEIAQRMVRYGIHHVFVRGSNGEPIVGVVSSFDILKKVAESEGEAYDREQ